MKSSKVEDIFDYNLEDPKTLSPSTYYQPFQSSFDPEFSFNPAVQMPRAPQITTWSRGPEKPAGSSHVSRGVLSSLNFISSLPALESPAQAKDSFLGASTSTRRELEGRTFCDSNWQNSALPNPSFSGYEERQTSKCLVPSPGSSGMYSQVSPNWDGEFEGVGGNHLGDDSFRTKRLFNHSAGQLAKFEGKSSQSSYYPLMWSASGRGFNQNSYKGALSRPMMCNFCKNNKEVPGIYMNHYLHDPKTKTLSCPVLRKHVCEICGGTGDQAHTLQYCPLNRERGLQSKVPVLLKTRTITNSTGKIRRE